MDAYSGFAGRWKRLFRTVASTPPRATRGTFRRRKTTGARLERFGFRIDFILLFDRPTDLPGELTDWLETFAEPYTSALPSQERPTLCREVQEKLRPQLCDANGHWQADSYACASRPRRLKDEVGGSKIRPRRDGSDAHTARAFSDSSVRLHPSLQPVPFAFAVERAGIDAQQNGRFLHCRRDGEQPADVLGFELFQRDRVADL